MKRYINYSIVYAVLAMVGWVFYQEFTKMNGYTAWTSLSVVHTHYFILGMMFFLILGLVSKNINLKINRAVLFYNIGLNLTAIMLVVRGMVQVLGFKVVSTLISGMVILFWVFHWFWYYWISKRVVLKVDYNPSFFWHYHIILIYPLYKDDITRIWFDFFNFFCFRLFIMVYFST